MPCPRLHPPGLRTSVHGVIRPPGATRVRAGSPHSGLLTPCWCERYHDYIPARDVANGRTFSCGGTGCEPREET